MFKGTRIWLTGASSGIGEALAIQLADAGAHLILSARNEKKLQALKESLPNAEAHLVVPLDLSDPHALEAELTNLMPTLPQVDVLINNAGISQRGLFLDSTLAVYHELIAVNYLSLVTLTHAVAKTMQPRKKGMIVAISSVAGKVGSQYRSGYSGSKYAVVGFMDCIRAELSKDNIHCLTVCPGSVKTAIAHNSRNEQGVAQNHSEASIENGMAVETCAQHIIKAMAKGKDEVVIGKGLSGWAPTIKRFFPGLFNRLTAKVTYR